MITSSWNRNHRSLTPASPEVVYKTLAGTLKQLEGEVKHMHQRSSSNPRSFSQQQPQEQQKQLQQPPQQQRDSPSREGTLGMGGLARGGHSAAVTRGMNLDVLNQRLGQLNRQLGQVVLPTGEM